MNFKKEYSHENIPTDVYKAIPNHASRYEPWLEKASESLQDFMYCIDKYYELKDDHYAYREGYLETIMSSPYFTKDVRDKMGVDNELYEAFAAKAPINALLSLDYASKVSQKERESLAIDLYCGCGNAFRYQRSMKEGEWMNFKDAFKEKGIEIKDEEKSLFDEYCKKPSSHKFNNVKSYEDRMIAYTNSEIYDYLERNDLELDDGYIESLTDNYLANQDEARFPKKSHLEEFLKNELQIEKEYD